LACPPGIEDEASVITHLAADAPPVYILHGGKDWLFRPDEHAVPLSLAWSAATGQPESVFLQLNPDSEHRMDLRDVNTEWLDRFLDDVVAGRLS
jgi:hypothetical protein